MATDVAAPLPQVDLQPQSTITVTLDDAGAKITRLSVHGFQDDTTAGSSTPSPVTGAYTTA
jgi:hypothetical protein